MHQESFGLSCTNFVLSYQAIAHAIVNVQSCSTIWAMEEYNRNRNTGGASIKVMYAQQYAQQGAMRYRLSKNTKLAYQQFSNDF